MRGISAPVFRLGGNAQLASDDTYARLDAPRGELALTGPSMEAAGANVPIRGDLAHIRLAGHFFVPHYAVPMPHCATRPDVSLKSKGSADGEVIGRLAEGDRFDVLEIAGGYAWGQIAGDPPHDNGLVGYVDMADLEVAATRAGP